MLMTERADVIVDLLELVGVYVVVMGAVSLVMGWHLFSEWKPPRYRRGVQVVPPVDAIGPGAGTVP